MSNAYDAILRDEYMKLTEWFGRERAGTIVELKLSYSDEGRLLAAETIVPSGYEITKRG